MARNAKTGLTKAEQHKLDIEAWKKKHPFTFVNIRLTDDEKTLIASDPPDADTIWAWFFDKLTSGNYSIKCGWDKPNSCWVLSVQGVSFVRDDFNRCVTSRHSDFYTVWGIAMYKFREYCSDGIPAPIEKSEDSGVFD